MKLNFTRNIGTIDRLLRLGFSFLMIYFGFFSNYLVSDRIAGLLLGCMGMVSLFVALIGYCPLYKLVDFSTHSPKTPS